ncbi:MAG TPA: hypothetical protein VEB19_10820 [Gemmatimonadaceae bacterium]|nr:hypothetical protein [Gemmatimonadaceae bacterium]
MSPPVHAQAAGSASGSRAFFMGGTAASLASGVQGNGVTHRNTWMDSIA